MKYKTIDLCAGIGGIRKGFELTGGFKNVLSAEIDEYACKTYEHLYKDNPRNDLTSDDFKKKCSDLDYDVLLAGFPCQTFSRAGKKAGFEDTVKGTIFFHILEIIKCSKKRPKVVFLENVDHLTTHDMEQYPDIKLPDHIPSKGKDKLYADLNDLLDKNVSEKFFMSQGYLETLEKHAIREKNKGNGFGYRIVNLENIEHPIANTILATGGSGKERNLILDKTNGKKYAGKMYGQKQTPINNKFVRVMTPMEWGKLQGFVNYAFINKKTGEDTFTFPSEVSDTQQYKLFGNSVTIPVIEQMASIILELLNTNQKNIGNRKCS